MVKWIEALQLLMPLLFLPIFHFFNGDKNLCTLVTNRRTRTAGASDRSKAAGRRQLRWAHGRSARSES